MPTPYQKRTMHPMPPEGAISYWPFLVVIGALLVAVGLLVRPALAVLGAILVVAASVLWVRQVFQQDWRREPAGHDETGPWWRHGWKNLWGVLVYMFTFWWFFSAALRAGIEHGLFDPEALPPPLLDVNTPLAAATTLMLLASGTTAYWATRTVSPGGEPRRLPLALGATLALGILFLLGRLWEVDRLLEAGLVPSMPIGSVFYWLLFIHGLLVAGALLGIAVVLWRALDRQFAPGRAGAVWSIVIFWWYTIALWLLIYALVYLKLVTYEFRLLA